MGRVLVLTMATWAVMDPSAVADDRYGDGAGEVGGPIGPIGHLGRVSPHAHAVLVNGAMGYGPPGLYPGFYGFGLSFHPGYGYGGNGLGVGDSGGYPCYGGPGYPARYGFPTFAHPYYEGIGPLVPDQPVVMSELMNAGDFGPYTGASTYASTHPTYTAEAAATGSSIPGVQSATDTGATNVAPEATFSGPSANAAPAPGAGAVNREAAPERFLGMDVEPVLDAGGRKALKIVNVLPLSTADDAGIQVGDIINSINGYRTEQGGHLRWIIAHAAPDKVLKMAVRKASDGKEQTITLRMP